MWDEAVDKRHLVLYVIVDLCATRAVRLLCSKGGDLVVVMGSVLALFLGLVIFSVVIKYLWSYLVVRLFPGAVEQNLITEDISWKVSIILAMIFLLIS